MVAASIYDCYNNLGLAGSLDISSSIGSTYITDITHFELHSDYIGIGKDTEMRVGDKSLDFSGYSFILPAATAHAILPMQSWSEPLYAMPDAESVTRQVKPPGRFAFLVPRVFVYDGREFPDPDPALSPDEVRRLLADFLPELANAEVAGYKRDNQTVFELVSRLRTKGSRKRGSC